MIPRRLRAAPPQPPEALEPPALPPAVLPEVIEDPTYEARVRFAIQQYISGVEPSVLPLRISARFGVTREQARLDVESMREFTAREMDDETNVGFFMLRKLAALEQLAAQLHEDAMEAIPTTEEGPDGPLPVSAQGRAALKGARVQAAKAFTDVSKESMNIVRRRSARYGDKPVVNVQIGGDGITEAQAEFLRRLNGE